MVLRIGVVIPCYKPHINLLKRLFDSIENQTKKPDMVIVSCSSSEDSDIPYKQEDYSFNFKIYTHKEKKITAQNKNFGARLINTDIITFFDADDIMHPQRIEIIYNGFIKNTNMKLLIHSLCINLTDLNFPLYDINNINYHVDPFYVCNWGSLVFKNSYQYNITNGHCSIHKTIFDEIQFIESTDVLGREDTIFNTTIVNKYPNNNYVGFCNCELTWYYPSGTHGIDST